MANKSLQHSSLTDNIFYRSMLAGNDAFFPEFESDDFLEEVVLSSAASSVTFSSLGTYATAGYKHLQIRMVAKTDYAVTQETVYAYLVPRVGSLPNYRWHSLSGNGSSVTSTEQGFESASGIKVAQINGTQQTNQFGVAVIDILDAFSTTKNTTTRSLTGMIDSTNDAYAKKEITLFSGVLFSTAAVSDISLSGQYGGNFIAGSRFSLYGSKG